MDETKSDQEPTRESEEATPEKNQLFEQMMNGGYMDTLLQGLSDQEQEEWQNFTAKTIEPYDRLIRMIREVTATQKGRDELYDEIMKQTDKK
jgi:hypothetical protein